jgi:hypothetical protein
MQLWSKPLREPSEQVTQLRYLCDFIIIGVQTTEVKLQNLSNLQI